MQRRSRRIYDEDFHMFKNEVTKIVANYQDSNEETRVQIKKQISLAIQNCQRHIGGDPLYDTGDSVSNRFRLFYSPRLRFLKKTYDQLQ